MERVPRHSRFRRTADRQAAADRRRHRAGAGDPGAAGLAATNRVAAAPSNTQPPVVSGTPEIGKELTTTNGTLSGSTPLSFTYQWRRCDKTGGGCANISNATDNTYKLQGEDGDNTLRAVVTARNSDGSDSATGVPTAVVPATPVSNNGCPADKSAKTAPIANLAAPARLQIVSFDVLSGGINRNTNSFTLKVRAGSTCGVNIKGASIYVTAVPYNQFSIPAEELTGDDGTATLVFHRDANFPASDQQQRAARPPSARREARRRRTLSPGLERRARAACNVSPRSTHRRRAGERRTEAPRTPGLFSWAILDSNQGPPPYQSGALTS